MVIVLVGVAGVGKTTLGERLAERLGWPFYDADDYHSPDSVAHIRTGLPLTDEHRAPWLERLATLIGDHVRAGTSMVLACSALTRAHRAALLADAPPGGDVRLVHLRAHEDLLAERLRSRVGHFFPAELLASQLGTHEPPTAAEPHTVLTLDASRTIEELVAEIRTHLEV